MSFTLNHFKQLVPEYTDYKSDYIFTNLFIQGDEDSIKKLILEGNIPLPNNLALLGEGYANVKMFKYLKDYIKLDVTENKEAFIYTRYCLFWALSNQNAELVALLLNAHIPASHDNYTKFVAKEIVKLILEPEFAKQFYTNKEATVSAKWVAILLPLMAI